MTFSLSAQADGGGLGFQLNWLESKILNLDDGVKVLSGTAEQGSLSGIGVNGNMVYTSNGYEGLDKITFQLSDGSESTIDVRALSESDSTINVSGRRINDDQFGPSRYANGNRYTINSVPYYNGETIVRITEQQLLEGIVNENGTTEGLSVTLDSSYVQTFGDLKEFDVTYVEEEKAYYISNINLDGQIGNTSNDAFLVNFTVTDTTNGYEALNFTSFLDKQGEAPADYVSPVVPEITIDEPPALQDPFEGYDPMNTWQPQRRVEINPGGPAAESRGDELVINDANGRLFGINNRASDSTYDDITGVAFVMGAEGSFDDGSIAGDDYVGTLEFDLKEGYRTTANFNQGQLSPIEGFISADGTLDGAMVDTETGEVLALFENVNVL